MNNNQTRSTNDSSQHKVNGWKWAFIALVLIIIGCILYLGFLLRPVKMNQTETQEAVQTGEQVSLTASLTKSDTEIIINEYLDESIGEEFAAYDVVLSDNLEIHGEMSIFNFDVPFTLYFSPYVLENGNIQLRGEAVDLTSFSLPVSGVMSLLSRQFVLPEFIAINSETQIIEIDLENLMQEYSFDLTVDQIDLEQDIVQFNLGFDKHILTNQMDN